MITKQLTMYPAIVSLTNFWEEIEIPDIKVLICICILLFLGLIGYWVIFLKFKNISNSQNDDKRWQINWEKHNYISIYIGILLLVFTVFLFFYFNVETTTAVGILTSILGIIASYAIYRRQEPISRNSHNLIEKVGDNLSKTDTVINKIGDNISKTDTVINKIEKDVLDLKLIKEDQDLSKTIKDWIKTKGDSDVVLFYFPYSLCPGFWNFSNTILKELGNLLDTEGIQWILIGPDKGDGSITSAIINKIKKNDGIIGDGTFKKKMNQVMRTKKNKGKSLADAVELSYENAFKTIDNYENQYEFSAYKLKPNEYNLFSFSFVLKMNNNRAQELYIFDTFNYFKSDLLKLKNHIGISSIINKDETIANESLKFLFRSPVSFLIKNQDMANFIFSMFLESCYKYNDLNKFLEDNLYDKNK